MQRNAAEELVHILWSSLPRPSPLHLVRRTKGDPSIPGFLHDLIRKSTQPEPTLKREKLGSIAHQAQVAVSAAVEPTSKINTDRDNHGLAEESRCVTDPNVCELESAFYTLLQDCINRKDLTDGRRAHCLIIREGFHQNVPMASLLIRMFAVCGSLSEANHVFCSFLSPDSSTWSAIISAHAYLGHGTEATKLFEQMMGVKVQPSSYTYIAALKACSIMPSLPKGRIIHCILIMDGCILDAHIGTMLIIMYDSCGSIEDGAKVYDEVSIQDDIISNVMMKACIHYGLNNKALGIFDAMQRQCRGAANVIAMVSGVKASTNLKDEKAGKLLHYLIIEGGFEMNTYACSALTAMYMDFGNFGEACYLFALLPNRTEVTWSSMIAASANLNDYDLAFKYFKEMQLEGVRPNDVTYLSILSACSHAGMLSEGLSHFRSMRDQHAIVPTLDHYNCVVDLLARAGHVVEAEDLLLAMPFRSDAVGCMALLSHCKTHGNVARGRTSFHYSNDSNLRNASSYLLMSDIYSNAGMQEDADKVKAEKKIARAYKKPGEASICMHDELHSFVVGEKVHPASIDIDAKLAHVSMRLKAEGYGYFPCVELLNFEHVVVSGAAA